MIILDGEEEARRAGVLDIERAGGEVRLVEEEGRYSRSGEAHHTWLTSRSHDIMKQEY